MNAVSILAELRLEDFADFWFQLGTKLFSLIKIFIFAV